MSNQYYNVSDGYQFSDVDVMLVGSASDEIVAFFLMNTGMTIMPFQCVVKLSTPTITALRYEGLKPS